MRLASRFSIIICIGISVLLLIQTYVKAAEKTNGVKTEPEVLELLLTKTPKPNYGVPVPVQITGRILSHSKGKTSGVEGVSVSDGYSVVKTDSNGEYRIVPNAAAVFINITRPSGFDIQGDWYKPLATKVNFELKPSLHNENDYIFVHVTDTHVSSNVMRSLEGLSRFVNEVNNFTIKPRFVINSGDLLNLHKALLSSPKSGHASFRHYVGIMNHLKMPHYNVAGDHTDSSYRINEFPRGDHRCAKPMFWEYLGPHFFSFEYGKIHFMSIDYGYHLGKRKITSRGKTLDYPTLEVQSMHTKWMRQDMSQRSKGTFVITSSEHDLVKYCPDFLEMAKKNDVRLQLIGDDHIVSYKSKPVPYRTGGALAGCWWNPKTHQICPDLSPQGYLIYHVVGEKMEFFYKGLGQRIAIVSPRMGAACSGQVEIQAHIVQPQSNEKLEYSLDGTNWKPMNKIGQPFYRTLYSATIDSSTLTDGYLNFSVKSNLTREIRTRIFVVVNGRNNETVDKNAILSFTIGSGKISLAGANLKSNNQRIPVGKAEVLFNGNVIGLLTPESKMKYSFQITATQLNIVNKLSFRFFQQGDGMTLSNPVLKFEGKDIRDPRDKKIRDVKTTHWGANAADWGGYIIGEAEPPDETPFQRKQDYFCFILK
jgi:N terminal of Calcineurin-like phosphoesterase